MRVRLGCWLSLAVALGGCGLLGPKKKADDATAGGAAGAPKTFVYVGTREGAVEVFLFDPVAGLAAQSRHRLEGGVTALGGPAFSPLLLALHAGSGVVVSFAVDPQSGALRPVHRMTAGGTQPASLAIDRSERYVLIPNRGSASVSVLPLSGSTGLRPATTFGANKGAHTLGFHPKMPLVLVGNDTAGTIAHYRFNPGTGVLTPQQGAVIGLPDDARPWRIACHPQGRTVYVLGAPTATIFVFAFDDRMGTMSRLASDAVPTASQPMARAPAPRTRSRAGEQDDPLGDLKIPPAGRFVLVTQAEEDVLASFAVDPQTGSLEPRHREPSGGDGPVALGFDPQGRFVFVLNRQSRTLATFALDPETGVARLVDSDRIAGQPSALHVTTPSRPR